MIILLILLTVIILYYFITLNKKSFIGSNEIISSTKDCVDKFNEDNLITDILGKTLQPLLLVSEIDKALPYARSCSYYTSMHLGQLKLLIGEIYFCSNIVSNKNDVFTLVYAGSAPNHKGFILNEMFPNMKALLVDPAEHLLYTRDGTQYDIDNDNNDNNKKAILYFCCAKGNKFNISSRNIKMFDGSKVILIDRDDPLVLSISDKWKNATDKTSYLSAFKLPFSNYIIEDYFDDNVAIFCKQLNNMVFISDIRTNIHNDFPDKYNHDVSDLDICVNSAMMLSWVNIMKPKLSMLKFRPPYYMNRERSIFDKHYNTSIYKYYFDKVKHQIDFVADYKKKIFNYIDGEEVLQAFAGTTSGETRLIFKDIKIKQYDYIDRESKLFYYNQIRRQYGFHDNIPDTIAGIDNCADCALSQRIIDDYNNKFNGNFALIDMLSILKRSLNIDNHGGFITMNNTIEDVYKQQGSILLHNYYLKSSTELSHALTHVKWNIDTIYQRYNIRKPLEILADNYTSNMLDEMTTIFEQYFRDRAIWDNDKIIRLYTKYILTAERGLIDDLAEDLLDDLDILYNKSYSTSNHNVGAVMHDNKMTLSYRDFSVDVSLDYSQFDKVDLMKSIMFNDTSESIVIPKQVKSILELVNYDHFYEISIGLYDRLFSDIKKYNYSNYTYVPFNKSNFLEDISNIPPKCVIFLEYNGLLAEHLIQIARNDTLLIFISSISNIKLSGYKIRYPYEAIDLMKNDVKFDVKNDKYTYYYFHGPIKLLRTIEQFNTPKNEVRFAARD